jgi:hypothetical protein
VVGEINCRAADGFEHPDPIFLRNHGPFVPSQFASPVAATVLYATLVTELSLQAAAPNRTVLGIIAKDGALTEFITLPAENLHLVPDSLTDQVRGSAVCQSNWWTCTCHYTVDCGWRLM